MPPTADSADSSPGPAQLPRHPWWQRLHRAEQSQAAKGSVPKIPGSGPDDGAHHPSSTYGASCEALGPSTSSSP
ncbi:unnamed protein product [Rangifer tarandus platyrhynchus]|uniref:Uncharacterized protein n=2 Tax=Rangifer tarandus platyrhynchus TaxID=3082113 RepID=A0ACB0F4C9_RANTA|nr:unnamed protein product [Rangifer tarandus platyrhynchus]CAI9707933.1 unnamed protein product [Rangifer tarandus platyrhynchus]